MSFDGGFGEGATECEFKDLIKMNNIETSSSSSTITLPNIGNGFEANTSSSTNVADSDASAKLAIGLVIGYIDDVLSAITNKKTSKLVDSGMKLKDMVEPLASDFSKLCEGISQGAKMFSDQKFITKSLSTEAHTMAVDVLKGVGNAHWAAVGLLAIANVLERLDKISSNDRECIDLLKGMLDLAKFIKMVKEVDAHFHKEILEKMSEALHLIVSGAILCHSFIRCNRISKFLLTKKICEELVYLRGKVDRLKVDMVLQMNYMFVSSCTFHLSRQQHITEDDVGQDQQHANDTVETFETNISIITTETVCVETQSPESGNLDISDKKNGFQLGAKLVHPFIAFGKYFKYAANGLRKIAGQRFDQCRKPVHTLSMNPTPSHLNDDLSALIIEHGFTFNELMTATNEFTNLLGQGGFAFTYRGNLTDGRHVVIKRSRNENNALQRELECITNLQHPNILDLVGSCIHGDELLLVYDYMSNGNLSSLLFGAGQSEVLDWPMREKIIHGVIRALVYLHVDACIVHRDIKPTNILLDENFNAKVSDFGISRKLPKGKSVLKDKAEEEGVYVDFEGETADAYLSTGVAGTLGYVAPECMMTGHVTRKSDIYSLGLLLLNVVSGKRCLELRSIKDGMKSLIKLAWKLHDKKRLAELIDSRLLNTEGFNSKSIVRTIKIALCCIQINPEKRPTASRVLEMLSSNERIRRPRQG